MANDFYGLTKTIRHQQKGRLVEFHGMFVRQNLEVNISWAPSNSDRAIENWDQRKGSVQLPPNIKMVFLVDRAGVQCVEISAQGGPGFQNVTLETFVRAPNPIDVAMEALETWLGQPGENSWRLVPTSTGIQRGEMARVLTHREARAEMLNRTREAELVEVAKTYAENFPYGTQAIIEKFGFTESTAHRRRKKAIALGLLPAGSSSKKDYEKVAERLANWEPDSSSQRSSTEVKKLLKQMKEGTLVSTEKKARS